MKHLFIAALAVLAIGLTGCPKSKKTGAKGVDASADTAVSAGMRAKIRTSMKGIQKACTTYNAKQGKWPADMADLVEAKVWQEKDRADPYGNDYVIEIEGNTVKVTTYGADGEPGGEGRNADFSVE